MKYALLPGAVLPNVFARDPVFKSVWLTVNVSIAFLVAMLADLQFHFGQLVLLSILGIAQQRDKTKRRP